GVCLRGFWRGDESGGRGGRDFQDFLGDGGLTGFVVFEREVAEQAGGVVLGGLHGDHAGRVFGGLGREDELEDLPVDVKGQEVFQDLGGRGLENHLPNILGHGGSAGVLAGLGDEVLQAGQRQHGADDGFLHEGVLEARVDDLDGVDRAFEEV